MLLVVTALSSALASHGGVQKVVRLRRQNTGSNAVKQSESMPTYAKGPSHDAKSLSSGSVEDAFHRQYQEHKERLSQHIFEEHSALTPLSQEQRQTLQEQRHKLMAVHFKGLKESRPLDRPLFLDGINQLRHPTLVYPEDAGASLKLGETWKFEQHGPYPALRLASLASHVSPSRHLHEELRNADHAIQLQVDLDKNGGTYRGLSAYTDDLPLLRTARNYFGSAYAQRDWRGTVIEELEQISERAAKRLRL